MAPTLWGIKPANVASSQRISKKTNENSLQLTAFIQMLSTASSMPAEWYFSWLFGAFLYIFMSFLKTEHGARRPFITDSEH